MLKFNNRTLKYNSRWLNEEEITRIYDVHIVASTGGTISASPTSGMSGTEVTLSNTPSTNYRFTSYSVTGATLKSSNKFDIVKSDVYAKGNFEYVDPLNPLGLPPYTARLLYKSGTRPRSNNGTFTQVSSSPNLWNWTYNSSNWSAAFLSDTNLLQVKGANSTNVTNMSSMFQGCTSLTSVALFDTSAVTNMNSMFRGCEALTSVASFNTSNVTNMAYMFRECASLTTVPLFDTSKVTTMAHMFYWSTITTVPFFNTSEVTDMSFMFIRCPRVTTVPLFNTSKVTNMESMFDECQYLQTVPLFDTSNVTNMRRMLCNCIRLQSLPLFDLTKVTNMHSTFANCEICASGQYNLYSSAANKSIAVTDHTSTFYYCGINSTSGAAELARIPSGWKSL